MSSVLFPGCSSAAGVSYNPEGWAGGEPQGGDDGGILLSLLRALCCPGHVYSQQP